MPCAPLLRFSEKNVASKSEAGEVMSGVLEIVRGSNLSNALSQSPKLPRVGCSRDSGVVSPPSQRVFVRIYRTSSEHFVVLYPIRAIVAACRPIASLNLKSCTVKPLSESSGKEFRVSSRSCEGAAVTFRALDGMSDGQMSDWLQAFSEVTRRKKVSDHRLPLPVLEESEEDMMEEQNSSCISA